LGSGLAGERMRLNHNPSQDKLSGYSGNYGSPPTLDQKQAKIGEQINMQKKNHGSRIGQGVLKSLGKDGNKQVIRELNSKHI
jgi:hypothetical protein